MNIMYNFKSSFLLFEIFLLSFCVCELSLKKKDELLNGFVEYYNRVPNQPYTCEVGYLQNAQQINTNCYRIDVIIKVGNSETTKYFKCTTTVQESEGNTINVLNNDYQCQDQVNYESGSIEEVIPVTTTEEPFQRRPVQLDNEVETNTAVTSGEQFIAIPRPLPSAPCIGCSTHINPQADGVSELASLGARQLDRHIPDVKHFVNSVLDVERQVQVVNGVRYILTLLIDFDGCKEEVTELCRKTQTCKVTILEKPWIKYGDGSKYRAILSNNCTEEWRFGDDGEVILDNSNNNKEKNEIDIHPNSDNLDMDVIRPVHNNEVQSKQNQEKIVTDQDIQNIEKQIIPLNKFNEQFYKSETTGSISSANNGKPDEHGPIVETTTPYEVHSNEEVSKDSNLSEDKKKAIDDLLSFLDYAGFSTEPGIQENVGRIKRSYDNDLEAMSIAERFGMIKQRIDNAKYLFSVGEKVVDHLNQMDPDFRTITLMNMLKAEEEFDGERNYFYIQLRASVPCDKFDCETSKTSKICNGVVEGSKSNLKVLSAFCSDESNVSDFGKIENVDIDDPYLGYLAKLVIKKLEKDSPDDGAIMLNKILSANTRKVSGTLTKLSILVGYLNCSKSVRDIFRQNCTLQEDLGSKICEVLIHEKERMKDRRITYTCTNRPAHVSFSNKLKKLANLDNPKIYSMVQDALQYLEVQSNRINKQKVVSVNSVSTQLNAGFLTKIEFTAGYTNCTDHEVVDISISNVCFLLENEPLRNCKAQIWDRSWVENGWQIEVVCDDSEVSISSNETLSNRVKRSLNFVGGVEPKDVDNPEYKTLAEESLLKFMLDTGEKQHYNIIKLQNVTTQVVSGSLTRIKFLISPTTCQIDMNGKPTSSNCRLLDSNDIINCNSVIWDQPWLENGKKINITCNIGKSQYNSRSKRRIAGGNTEQDPNLPKYKRFAVESLHKYIQSSGISESHEVVKVNKVTTQVVAGLKTNIEFTVAPSDNSEDTFSCSSNVWERSWLDSKEITVNCSRTSRSKRGIPGGEIKQDPNDPKYKSLAVESLHKYIQSSGISESHEVVKVNKVTTQVVAGVLSKIEFTVAPSDNLEETFSCSSKVWERPWLDSKEITVNCSRTSRFKRGIPGGEIKQDPNDPKYKSLAVESLHKYIQSSGISESHEVVKVNKVTTQVVAGELSKIEFTVAPSDNLEETFSCSSKVWERPWLDSKEITVNCSRTSRSKRGIPGGEIKQDPNDPKYKSLAVESLHKYIQSSGISESHEVVKVNKVTTQVVAGVLSKIEFTVAPSDNLEETFSCSSKVWEKPWLDSKEITVNCSRTSRSKRGIVPGVEKEQDPNDPKYKSFAVESLHKYIQSSGISESHEVVKVNKVTTQVVAGLKTNIEFTVAPSDNSEDTFSCSSNVWERSWLDSKEITVNCSRTSRSKRGIPGGEIKQDPNDPKYKSLAVESLHKYIQSSGISESHEVVKVNKVTTQVVAGVLSKIEFTVAPSDNLEETFSCSSKVWERPWLDSKEITVNCSRTSRSKRGIVPGGEKEQDPNDPKYKSFAVESLHKYIQSSGISESHEVVKVNKVTTQVVAGLKTNIEFTVAPSDNSEDTFSCSSKVWEQPWKDSKEIKVDCQPNMKEKISNSEFTGGFIENDPSDPRFMVLAQKALEKYTSYAGISQPHRVFQVEKVMTQVISGTHTVIHFLVIPEEGRLKDLLSCHSDIWEKPWADKMDIDVHCYFKKQMKNLKLNDNKQLSDGVSDIFIPKDTYKNYSKYFKIQNTFRKKRETLDNDTNNVFRRPTATTERNAVTFGSNQEQDPTKAEYKTMAQNSLLKYIRLQNLDKAHRIIQVKRVRTRVVSGILYKIDFKAAPTTCSADIPMNLLDNCKLQNNVILFCHTDIWSRPWLQSDDIKITCNVKRNNANVGTTSLNRFGKRLQQNNRRKRHIDAEEYDIEEDTKNYYADRAIQHINQISDSHNLYKLITIHAVKKKLMMDLNTIHMYIEVSQTYCLKHSDEDNLVSCDELDGTDHKICLARLTPSQDDELILASIDVVCDDDTNFEEVTGISLAKILQASINQIESSPQIKYKLVHIGDPMWTPTLDPDEPVKLKFLLASTNCSKDVDFFKVRSQCFYDISVPSKVCYSYIWLAPFTNKIDYVQASCNTTSLRLKRALNENATEEETALINELVQLSLEKLEMTSQHRYKQRLLKVNSYSTKITSGKVTTIDFDVGYTSCVKYEWVDNMTSCEFLEHLPRRHCVSQIWERLWLNNGRNIEVNCEDDETPLESHIEFESAEMGMQLAKEALKHIEAKYPNPRKQQVVRIFNLEKQVIAGVHYRMKIEVGSTNCFALSAETDCKIDKEAGLNKFCRVNVWMRPWTQHPPNFRVQCDYQDTATAEVYHHVQAEYLFFNFLTTYKPEYINNHKEMGKRFDIFKDNIRRIHELNTHERGTATYGITRFADLTYEEFSGKYMGLKPTLRDDNRTPMGQARIPTIDIPENFDWREYNAVTGVKDQGSCGSCWAFSVTGNIEGQWKMQSGQLLSLSEQELIDCDKMDQGCNGGLMDNAYRAIEQLGGLELENDYPYEGDDDKCVFNKTLSKVQISGAVNISSNETNMAKWLVKNGPISIGINANAMQFYMGGISHPWRMLCNPKNLDHGVLIVGYGIKDYPLFNKRLPYWTVKNSWGTSWGEQGYYRVFRGDGTCGVNQMASSSII